MFKTLKAKSGVRYGISGADSKEPSPILLNIANDIESTLQMDQFNKIGCILEQQGFRTATLDSPCHGRDQRKNEPEGMLGWRKRMEKGEPFIEEFSARASAVMDDLIASGRADPERIVLCGTSRGGFLALHLAAAEPRPKCVVAFAPLTHPYVLREFAGAEENPAVRQTALTHIAPKLAGRSIWVVIGSNDYRVETDQVIGFTRRVIEESMLQNKPYGLELHVVGSDGHGLPEDAHEQAAAWVSKQLAPEK